MTVQEVERSWSGNVGYHWVQNFSSFIL